MTQIWIASITHAILGLGPGVQTVAAQYDKQFGPIPGNQLWGVLLVISFFVLLAGVAGWFFMTEADAAKGKRSSKRNRPEGKGEAAEALPVISKKRLHPRKSRKKRARRA